MLYKNTEDRIRMTFGFKLYAVPLQVTLVIYFRRRLMNFSRLRPLEGR